MDLGADKLANMVLTGKLIRESGILPMDLVLTALEKMIPPKKKSMVEVNKKMLLAGYDYE